MVNDTEFASGGNVGEVGTGAKQTTPEHWDAPETPAQPQAFEHGGEPGKVKPALDRDLNQGDNADVFPQGGSFGTK